MTNPWREFMQISNRDHLVLTDELEAILEFNTKVNDKYKIHTNIMPAPFMGDVKNAPVVILALNPGFDQKEQERGFYNEYKNYWTQEIQHEYNKKTPLFCLDDSYCDYSNYWSRVLSPIVKEVGRDVVARNVCKIQFFPYQSQKFKSVHKSILKKYGYINYLPSQEYNFELVKDAMRRKAMIIIPRAIKKWEGAIDELKNYDNKLTTNSYGNITLSEKNLGEDFHKVINKLSKL